MEDLPPRLETWGRSIGEIRIPEVGGCGSDELTCPKKREPAVRLGRNRREIEVRMPGDYRESSWHVPVRGSNDVI